MAQSYPSLHPTTSSKKKSIDPLTGLELSEVEPSPAQNQAMIDTLTPAANAAPPPPEVAQPVNAFDPSGPPTASATQAPPMRNSFLDTVIGTLFGVPDSKLEKSDPQEVKARQSRRSQASAGAKSAAENPGEAFMDIPVAGSGKGGGESMDGPMQFIASLVKMIGGGG